MFNPDTAHRVSTCIFHTYTFLMLIVIQTDAVISSLILQLHIHLVLFYML